MNLNKKVGVGLLAVVGAVFAVAATGFIIARAATGLGFFVYAESRVDPVETAIITSTIALLLASVFCMFAIMLWSFLELIGSAVDGSLSKQPAQQTDDPRRPFTNKLPPAAPPSPEIKGLCWSTPRTICFLSAGMLMIFMGIGIILGIPDMTVAYKIEMPALGMSAADLLQAFGLVFALAVWVVMFLPLILPKGSK